MGWEERGTWASVQCASCYRRATRATREPTVFSHLCFHSLGHCVVASQLVAGRLTVATLVHTPYPLRKGLPMPGRTGLHIADLISRCLKISELGASGPPSGAYLTREQSYDSTVDPRSQLCKTDHPRLPFASPRSTLTQWSTIMATSSTFSQQLLQKYVSSPLLTPSTRSPRCTLRVPGTPGVLFD